MHARTPLPGAPLPARCWEGSNGLRIAADSWGDPADPLVILQHGGGQTRHAWRGAGEALARAGFHAVAFDARGHGDSDWDPEIDYTSDAMVRDLVCLIEQLGDLRPVLVGASMGGSTSLIAAGEGSVDASALVLVDVAPRTEPDGAAHVRAFMYGGAAGFDSLEDVAASIRTYQPERPAPRDLKGLAKNVRQGNDGRYYWHWDPRIDFAQDDLVRRERLGACASRLRIPTLLVRGGLSDVLSEEGAQDFLRLCPSASYVNVTGAGHMVAGDRNDHFTSALIAFLRSTFPHVQPHQRS